MTMDQIQTVVGLQLGRAEVPPEARIIEDLGAESMDVVGIVAAVEDKYRIVIAEEEVPTIHTVRDLYDLASERVAHAGAR